MEPKLSKSRGNDGGILSDDAKRAALERALNTDLSRIAFEKEALSPRSKKRAAAVQSRAIAAKSIRKKGLVAFDFSHKPERQLLPTEVIHESWGRQRRAVR